MESVPVVESATPSYRFCTNADLENSPPAAKRTAVLVVHGMGQQRKFETLSSVVDGLRRVAGISGKPNARNVAVGDERLSLLEIELADHRQVDVYEAYWSSITEGQITIRDVMGFLTGAAWNGFWNAGRTFRRWVFGEHREFTGGRATKAMLILTACVLFSLVFLNSLVVALGAMKVMRSGPPWLRSGATINDLTAAVLMLLAVFAGFGIVYFAAGHQKKKDQPLTRLLFVSRCGRWYFIAMAVYTVIVGLSMALTIGFHRNFSTWDVAGHVAGATVAALGAVLLLAAAIVCLIAVGRSRAKLLDLLGLVVAFALAVSVVLIAANRSAAAVTEETWTLDEPSIFDWIPADWSIPFWSAALLFVMARWVMIWAALAAVSARVRRFLVQYVGDVAAYVTPSVLDRFDTIRDRIKACIYTTANAIYRAGDPNGHLLYDSVVVVGHSLGSVAAYDCLNRLLNEDAHGNGVLRVLERTKGFLTFGSPLDKTAFIFETNIDEPSANRAALAATVQPLITVQATKAIPWSNIYSKWDIISGELNFYDDPTSPTNRVTNDPDYDAVLPVGAHTEYWNNALVWQHLNRFIP